VEKRGGGGFGAFSQASLKMVNATPALWASKQPQVAKQDEAEDKKV
jgi:hypothetical protein